MALPDSIVNTVGTALDWESSGGDYAITLTSVTNGNGRQGVKGDLGASRARIWDVMFQAAVGSAATAGNTLDLYWAASDSGTAGTDNPGGTSGTDATFNTTPSEYAAQLLFIGSLVLSNNAGTGVQTQWFSFVPPCRYGMPVVVNSSGQTLSATAGNFVIRFIPRLEQVID